MTTTYTVPDLTGTGRHLRIDITPAQLTEFGDTLTHLFEEGVARFGSVDAFAAALELHNAEREVAR